MTHKEHVMTSRIEEAQDLINKLQLELDSFKTMRDIDEYDWGDIGDLGRAIENLGDAMVSITRNTTDGDRT